MCAAVNVANVAKLAVNVSNLAANLANVAVNVAVNVAGGDSYGSRWSRAKRETTGLQSRIFSTPAGVAERIHAVWYLVRDPCRGR